MYEFDYLKEPADEEGTDEKFAMLYRGMEYVSLHRVLRMVRTTLVATVSSAKAFSTFSVSMIQRRNNIPKAKKTHRVSRCIQEGK